MTSHSPPVAGPEFELKQPVSRVWGLSDLAFLSLGKKQLLASGMIQNLEEETVRSPLSAVEPISPSLYLFSITSRKL